MITIVWIYGISWLILLLFCLYIRFVEKDQDISYSKNLYMVGAVILFAPLVILLALIIVFISAFKETKDDVKYKVRQKNIEKYKIQATNNFNQCHRSLLPVSELADVANRLRSINVGRYIEPISIFEEDDSAFKEEYNSVNAKILACLNSIRVPDGYRINIEPPECVGCGGRSFVVVENAEGKQCTNIFDMLEVDCSPMGAWQAYLLYEMWHYLSFFWHGYYDQRYYIYSKKQLQNMSLFDEIDSSPLSKRCVGIKKPEKDLLLQLDINPVVYQKDDKFYVSSCYWSDFEGLVREVVEIEIKKNKAKIFDVCQTVLHQYHCGIMY